MRTVPLHINLLELNDIADDRIRLKQILAALAGWRGHPKMGTLNIAGVRWLSWAVDAATSDNSGLWAIGALALLPSVSSGLISSRYWGLQQAE
ncbi:hypothetical protein [Microbispora sp. CA-102843]|uniref:hypothetical protein n=1 Tax=Microbispora sp. CA-102843 TaxID=3239952 RepID=UPI003D89C2D6